MLLGGQYPGFPCGDKEAAATKQVRTASLFVSPFHTQPIREAIPVHRMQG